MCRCIKPLSITLKDGVRICLLKEAVILNTDTESALMKLEFNIRSKKSNRVPATQMPDTLNALCKWKCLYT